MIDEEILLLCRRVSELCLSEICTTTAVFMYDTLSEGKNNGMLFINSIITIPQAVRTWTNYNTTNKIEARGYVCETINNAVVIAVPCTSYHLRMFSAELRVIS